MGLAGEDLITLTKQHVGNRASVNVDRDWYLVRVQDAYQDLTTLSVPLPQGGRRVVRFDELYDTNDVVLPSAMTSNFQASQSDTWSMIALYDLDNNRDICNKPLRMLLRDNPTSTGRVLRWAAYAKDGVAGYLLWKIPSSDLNVRESVYKRAETLADDSTEPVIPDDWHECIHIIAGSKAARLLNLPDLSTRLSSDAINMIQAKRLPREESQRQRRTMMIGARSYHG